MSIRYPKGMRPLIQKYEERIQRFVQTTIAKALAGEYAIDPIEMHPEKVTETQWSADAEPLGAGSWGVVFPCVDERFIVKGYQGVIFRCSVMPPEQKDEAYADLRRHTEVRALDMNGQRVRVTKSPLHDELEAAGWTPRPATVYNAVRVMGVALNAPPGLVESARVNPSRRRRHAKT